MTEEKNQTSSEAPDQDKIIADKLAAQSETIAKHEQTIAENDAMISIQKGTIEDYARTIEDCAAKIVELKAEALSKAAETKISFEKKPAMEIPDNVEIRGVEHRWNLPAFIHKGQMTLAEDASLDQDLLKELVDIPGQGILTEVV